MEPEIIDLTKSSPTRPDLIDLTSDCDEDAAPVKNGKKKIRKRNRKQKARTTENGQAGSSVAAAPKEDMARSRRDDTSHLYFIDVAPAPLPPSIAQPQPETQEPQVQPDTLLLPSHVAVFGNESIQIVLPSQKELGEDDYIEYLAYDDYKVTTLTVSTPPRLMPIQDIPRYFDDQAKQNKSVCKNCGAEGEHKTFACPVVVVCVVSFASTLRRSSLPVSDLRCS